MKHRKLYGFLVLGLALALTLVLILVPSCGKKDGATADGDNASGIDPTTFSYSTGLDENGFWAGIKALDCVTPADYQKITIPKTTHEISDEKLQTEIDNLMAQYATSTEIKDRAVKDGDKVNIDYVGSVGGVEFEGGSTNGAGAEVEIGVTSFIDDFLDQVIGHKPGDTFDVNVTFPADYGVEELNGKDAVFVTTVNYIVGSEAQELTDTFVSENLSATSGWTTVAQMKDGIRADLQKIAVSAYLVEYLLDNSQVKSLPEVIVETQEMMMANYFEQQAAQYQVELGEFLSTMEGVNSMEELKEKNRSNNEKESTYLLIVQAIAEKEGITVTSEDLEEYFAKEYPGSDYTQFETQYGMPYLKMTVLSNKVAEHVRNRSVME